MCVHGMTNDLQSEVQARSCKQTTGMFAQLSQKASSKVSNANVQTWMLSNVHLLGRDAYLLAN